jgi:hypothetical protein
MTWSADSTWLTEGGTWRTAQGPATTAQGQSTFAQGGLTILGAGSSSQAQTTIASSVMLLINGEATTEQGAQTALVSGPVASVGQGATFTSAGVSLGLGGMTITGATATSQGPGTSSGYGFTPATSAVREALERLLRYPHDAVFDKSPQAGEAIRFNAADVSYSITGDVLEIHDGVLSRYFSIGGRTVQELAQAIDASGVDAFAVSTLAGFSADVILHDDGAPARSRVIYGFTSLLWVVLHGYAHEIADAAEQVVQALRQMVITQAEGEWLDVWGTLYGINRLGGETDKAYAPRIPEEAFRLRVNAFGIEKAIRDATGYDVRIQEPWKEIFTLDVSLLSGPDKFYDGDTIGYHLIQPVSGEAVDWDLVMPVIHRNRAAGVMVLNPRGLHISGIDASGGTSVDSGATVYRAHMLPYEDRVFLDYSAIEDAPIVNHSAIHQRQVLRISEVDVEDQGWVPHYVADSLAWRDYRRFVSEVSATGVVWTGQRTWANANATWAGIGPLIDSAHTSTT